MYESFDGYDCRKFSIEIIMSQVDLWWRNPGADPHEIWTLVPDSEGQTTFHLAPFVESPEHPHCMVRGRIERSELPDPGSIALPKAADRTTMLQSDYLKSIGLALDSIENTPLKKVVLSRSDWRVDQDCPESAFARKCFEHPDALVYLLNIPKAGVWMGATPELLLNQKGTQFETVSLAGTREAGQGAWTSKELREQAVVTEFIAKQLEKFDAQKIFIEPPVDRTYGSFVHLQSRIHFESSVKTKDLLEALHPTPAVGGEPREQALRFIASHEVQSRGYYAGYFGWTTGGQSTYYVNLRCMQWFDEGARIYAGGGIVAGSNPLAEWQETVIKLQSIR